MKEEKMNNEGTNGFVPVEDKSIPITFDDAKDLIGNYNDLPNEAKLKVLIKGQQEVLHGFTFDIEHALELAQINGVKSLFLAIAYKKNQPSGKPDGYTTVLFGMDENDNLITTDRKMYDYCDPCPDRCPKNVKLEDL